MPNFAHIENDMISNIVFADTLEMAESVIGIGKLIEIKDHEHGLYVINDILDNKKKKELEKSRADRQAKLDAEAKAIAEAEAKRLADIEKNRIDEAKPVSILPPVKGKFKSAGDN